MPVLSKHAVLCGDIDYCCLVCEVTFRDREEACRHVDSENHKGNFALSCYVEKYAAEHIRKVRQWLYCEACNVVISSSRKVQQHVSDEEHEFNNTSGEVPPTTSVLKRFGRQVIAFENVLIEEEPWNGIIEESCIVCDVDWDHLQSHITDAKHIVNLIQARVQSGINNTLFRKIDNSHFHCLTCNVILPQDEFVMHWDSKEHQKLHIQCRKAKRAADEVKDRPQQMSTSTEINYESRTTENKILVGRAVHNDDVGKEVAQENTDEIQNNADKVYTKNLDTNSDSNFNNGSKSNSEILELKETTTYTKLLPHCLNSIDIPSTISIEEASKLQTDANNDTINNDTTNNLAKADNSSFPAIHINTDVKEMVQEPIVYKKDKPKVLPHCLNSIDIPSTISKEAAPKSITPEPVKDKENCNMEEFLYKDLNQELDLQSYMIRNDNELCLCVLCNWEFKADKYKSHLNTEHHKILEVLHKEDVNKLNEKIMSQHSKDVKGGMEKEKQTLFNMMEVLKKERIEVNFISETASCKKCKKSIECNPNTVLEHIALHTNEGSNDTKKNIDESGNLEVVKVDIEIQPVKELTPKSNPENELKEFCKHKTPKSNPEDKLKEFDKHKTPKSNPEDELKEFYKHNRIEVNDKHTTCLACNIEMAYVKKCINEHINGARHKRNLTKLEEMEESDREYSDLSDDSDDSETEYDSIEKVTMDKHIVLCKLIDDMVIVNNHVCITVFSYCLCLSNGCLICSKIAIKNDDEFESHVNGAEHKKNMAGIPVMISFKNELVREIKRNNFHCGICDNVVYGWSTIQRHLKSDDHLHKKIGSNVRLMLQRDVRVSDDLLKFIRRVNESTGKTYFT